MQGNGLDSKSTLIIVFWDGGKTQISFMFIPDLLRFFHIFPNGLTLQPPTSLIVVSKLSFAKDIFQLTKFQRERERFHST